MIEQASLVIGNGNWAVKSDNLLGYKLIDGKYYPRDMSVVRATTATRVNEDGLVEVVPYNLLNYSQDFLGAWPQNASPTITTDNLTAPNGTLTADTFSTSANASGVYQIANVAIGSTYTFSVYIKNISGATAIIIGCDFAPANGNIIYNAVTNTITTTGGGVISTSVENTGNGWFRVSGTYVATGAANSCIVYAGTSSAMQFGVWGAQLVEGSVAKDYLPTTDRLDVARVDYSTGSPALLVEPQRTNRLTYSENQGPSGTNWWPTATWSVVNNSVISPSGIQNADTLVEATSNGYHAGYFNSTIANGFTGTYTISAYAKYNGRFFVLSPKGDAQRTYFNLQNGTIAQLGSGVTASIEDAGNGWYRCIVTCSFSSENVNFEYLLASAVGTLIYTGDGTSGVYIWGCQAEEGSYSTSYIPTTSASVTRNADLISKTGISSLIGQTEGTMFVEAIVLAHQDNNTILSVNDGSLSEYMVISGNASGEVNAFILDSGNVSSVISGTYAVGTTLKCALAYKTNDVAYYINGVQIGVDTSVTIPTTSQVNIGSLNFLTAQLQGNIKAAALWKTRLTNTQLAELTTL